MTALSADATLRMKGEPKIEKFILDTSGSQIVYKGEGVVIDQNVDAENAHTARGLTLVDGDVFLGIAAAGKSVLAGDPERYENAEISVFTFPTILGFKSAVFTNADLGKTVYMSDTGTLSESNGAYPRIGKLFKVEDGYAYVELDTPFVLNVP